MCMSYVRLSHTTLHIVIHFIFLCPHKIKRYPHSSDIQTLLTKTRLPQQYNPCEFKTCEFKKNIYLCKESNWNTYTLRLSIRGLWNRNPYKQGFKPNTRILQGKAFTAFSLEVHEHQCSSLNKPWPFFPSRPQDSCSSLSSPVLSRNEGGIRGQESDEVKCYTNKLGFS